MLKKIIKSIILCSAFVLLGFFIGLIVSEVESIRSGLKLIKWDKVTYWFAIIIGFAIPIILNYFMVKKQEIIKLKAIVAKDKIEIIKDFKKMDNVFRTSILLPQKWSDIDYEYKMTDEDATSPTVRTALILENKERFDDYYIKIFKSLSSLGMIDNNKLLNYVHYIRMYFLNLHTLLEQISVENYWQVGIIAKHDLMEMYSELEYILDMVLHRDIYKLRINYSTKKYYKNEKHHQKMRKTYLFEYMQEIQMKL